ncbi:MAG: 23S rRNA (pseudouridine(1915)-N(3))-methyltransferase RlmH [Pseudomonadota bacterium]
MQVQIVTISRKPQGWVGQATEQYTKRISKPYAIDITYLSVGSNNLTKAQRRERDSNRLLEVMQTVDYGVCLDERGEQWTSVQLAQRLEKWSASYKKVLWVIGGAEGVSEAVREKAHVLWSVSPLTLPHQFLPVLLAEQLYRATTIVRGHPYHRH